MKLQSNKARAESEGTCAPKARRGLFRKYVMLFVTVVCGALVTSGLFDVWFSFREQEALLVRIQRGQAESAAAKISQYIQQIVAQLAWTTQFSWAEQSLEEQLADMARVLGLVPAVMELTRLDPTGHEQLQVSRMTASRVGSNLDLSQDPKFSQAKANQVYYGPVYFRQGTEPYMTLAIGARGPDAGVTIAEISLKYIWDVVSRLELGEH